MSNHHQPHFDQGCGFKSFIFKLKKFSRRIHFIRRKRRGINMLYEDVRSCQCEDVQMLWSMVVESSSYSSHGALREKDNSSSL